MDTQAQFIKIMRSFVADEPPALDGGSVAAGDAAELIRCAARQNLLPVLAYVNKKWKLFSDASVTAQLDNILYGAIAGNLNRCVDFEALSDIFTEHGIAHMPVKGYYLRGLYPLAELRAFGDIDILIRPSDRQKVHRLMLSLGYTVGHDWEPTYSYRKGSEYYEIHTNLMDGDLDGRSDLRAYFGEAWAHAVPDAGMRFMTEDDFHFTYTVCHLAKHLYGGGAGIRMYLDVAFYILRRGDWLDLAHIRAEFERLRLDGFFFTVMNAVREWFGVDAPCPLPEPDREALGELLDYTLSADLFGHTRDRSVVRLREGGKSRKGVKSTGIGVFIGTVFPPAARIESRYTFLIGRHWLLPVAWVVRIFANIRLIPTRIAEMRRVSRTGAAAVDEYDGFMKRIGL